MAGMVASKILRLQDRALIGVCGADWRPFLQGLLTQDVETLSPGDVRYAALLTPQGRLLFDMFVWADENGGRLDVLAETRDALIARLSMYRLRAKVEITALEGRVLAFMPDPSEPGLGPGAPAMSAVGWRLDPRLPALGWRGFDTPPQSGEHPETDAQAYEMLRLRLGIADMARDRLTDRAYALEANLDLLHGVDFRKGCFVGQETTSRMKRRGSVKSRLLPITFEGEPPPTGSEVLAGTLRAGEVASGQPGLSLALLRLDRASGAPLQVDGRAVALAVPDWLAPVLSPSQSD